MPTIVYRYGVIGRPTVPPEIIEQLRLANRMRNALVELEHAHDEAMRQMWAAHPDVGAVEEKLTLAEDELLRLSEQTRREHSEDRTVATRPATAAAVCDARKAVKQLRAARRVAIAEAYPVVKPQIEALRAQRKAAVKACRQEYAASGLHWGTYNAVAAGHETAVKLVSGKRKQGQAAQLRFRRFDGTGTVTVQLQRQAGDPVRSPELLASGGGKWRNVLRLGPWLDPDVDERPRGKPHRVGEVAFSVGGGRLVTLPIRLHRMIPAAADVCEAQLTVRRVGGHSRIHLSVTVKVPDPPALALRAPVALHVGWRQRGDGSVRVGTWSAAEPLRVPAALLHEEHPDGVVTVDGDHRRGEVVLPARWLDLAGRPESLRSRRDVALEPVARKLAEWLDEHPQPATDDGRPGLTGAEVRRWRSPGRFAALVLRWREDPPAGGEELVTLLEAWRAQDRHLWEWEANERAQLTARRDDAWRRVGAWLAEAAGMLLVDDADLATLRRRGDVAEDDPVMPGEVAQSARARAALSAPGRLRQLATTAAIRRAVPVVEVETAYATRTCPHCGQVGDAHPRYAASAVVICPACSGSYDQDRSVAQLMLTKTPR